MRRTSRTTAPSIADRHDRSEGRIKRYSSFREFYPFYLSEHAHPMCRRLHFAGSLLAIGFTIAAIAAQNVWWLVAAALAGYGFAWVGHFFFEHNRPTTFTHPIYSLMGDWVMFRDMLIGRIRWRDP